MNKKILLHRSATIFVHYALPHFENLCLVSSGKKISLCVLYVLYVYMTSCEQTQGKNNYAVNCRFNKSVFYALKK